MISKNASYLKGSIKINLLALQHSMGHSTLPHHHNHGMNNSDECRLNIGLA